MPGWDEEPLGTLGSAAQIPTGQWFDVNTETGQWGTPAPTLASAAGVPAVGPAPRVDASTLGAFGGVPDQAPLAIGQVAGTLAPPMTMPASMQRVARLDDMGALTPKPGMWETIARGIGMASPIGRSLLQASDQQQQQQLTNRLALRRQALSEEQNERAEIRDDFNTFVKLSEVKSKALRNLYTDRWVADMQARGKAIPADLIEAFKKTGLDDGKNMAKLLEPLLTESGLDPAIATQLLDEGRSPKDIMDAMELAQKQKKLRLEQQEISGLDASRQQMFGTVGDASGATAPAAPTAPGAPTIAPASATPRQPVAAPSKDISDAIDESSRLYPQVRKELITSIAASESNFDPKVTSPKGAQGVMQLMPAAQKEMRVTDPFDVQQNVRGGTGYYAKMLERYKGNEALALAAYNWGPGNVDSVKGDLSKMPDTVQTYVKTTLQRAAAGGGVPTGVAQRPDTRMMVAGPGAPAPTAPTKPTTTGGTAQGSARLTQLNQQIDAMDQFLQANIGRGSERTRAAVTQVERLRDNLTKERDQLTEPSRAGVRAQSETRGRTTVEREMRGETTLAEAFKGETPSLYDTQTGQTLDARMKVKDYEALPQGRAKMLSNATREQMEQLNASAPIIEQLQTHIDKIYGPGGVLARMTPDDRSLLTSGTSVSQRLLDQLAQKYPELIQAQRFIDSNAGALARSLAGEKGAMAEGDVERAKAMLPQLLATLKVWPLSQIGVRLPDTRAVALGTMNSLVDMMNARGRTLLGNEQYQHPKLHRYETAEEAQQQTGSGGPQTTRPRPQDIAPEGTPAVGLNPTWRVPVTPPAATAGAPASGQRALQAMSPAQLRQLPDRLVQTLMANPGMAAGLSPEQNGALMERLNQWERFQDRR